MGGGMDSSSTAGGSPVTIRVVRNIEKSLVDAIDWLVPQLSGTASVPGRWELEQMIADPGAILLVAESSNVIVGMLALVVFRTPTGVYAKIEDLVVDQEDQRGEATEDPTVMERLIRRAVKTASSRGAQSVKAHCLPSEIDVAKAFERLGFERLSTNAYQYKVSG